MLMISLHQLPWSVKPNFWLKASFLMELILCPYTKFFLESPITVPECTRIPLYRFPPDIIQQYILWNLITDIDIHLYIKINGGMHNLKHATTLAHNYKSLFHGILFHSLSCWHVGPKEDADHLILVNILVKIVHSPFFGIMIKLLLISLCHNILKRS